MSTSLRARARHGAARAPPACPHPPADRRRIREPACSSPPRTLQDAMAVGIDAPNVAGVASWVHRPHGRARPAGRPGVASASRPRPGGRPTTSHLSGYSPGELEPRDATARTLPHLEPVDELRRDRLRVRPLARVRAADRAVAGGAGRASGRARRLRAAARAARRPRGRDARLRGQRLAGRARGRPDRADRVPGGGAGGFPAARHRDPLRIAALPGRRPLRRADASRRCSRSPPGSSRPSRSTGSPRPPCTRST